MILPAFLYRYALFRVPCVLFSAMRSTQKLNLTLLMYIKTIVYEGIFWYIVRLLLGGRDVTLGKSTPPKGWHFREFCLIKCLYATLKLFGLSCFQPYPIGHTRKIASSLFLFYLIIFQWYFESDGFLACVASVSVWFRSKERQKNGILG